MAEWRRPTTQERAEWAAQAARNRRVGYQTWVSGRRASWAPMIEMYQGGSSVADVAAHFGRSQGCVRHALRSTGERTRSRSTRRRTPMSSEEMCLILSDARSDLSPELMPKVVRTLAQQSGRSVTSICESLAWRSGWDMHPSEREWHSWLSGCHEPRSYLTWVAILASFDHVIATAAWKDEAVRYLTGWGPEQELDYYLDREDLTDEEIEEMCSSACDESAVLVGEVCGRWRSNGGTLQQLASTVGISVDSIRRYRKGADVTYPALYRLLQTNVVRLSLQPKPIDPF